MITKHIDAEPNEISSTNITMKIFVVLWFLILASVLAEGRRFNNPVIDNGDYPDPGAIKADDGKYYVVTTSNNDRYEKFPIHSSSDLQNWTLIGNLFDEENQLPWGAKDRPYWAPELHKIGSMYRAYFTAGQTDQNAPLCIGVTSSKNPGGPYIPEPKPLLCEAIDPSIVTDNGTYYLYYMAGNQIHIRRLTPDGLGFAEADATTILQPELPWEYSLVEAPFYFRRNQYHYLFYSGHGDCGDENSIGVARSLNVYGPYEKHGDPIVVWNDPFRAPDHNSIVKDLNDQDDIIVYHAFKKDFVCGDNNRVMLVSSLAWENDWPYIIDNN